MSGKRVLVFICLLTLIIGSFLWIRQEQLAHSAQTQTAEELQTRIPDYVTYKHLFHHVVAFKKEGEAEALKGRDGSPFINYFKRKAELSEHQAQTLNAIASECDDEVKQLDARAKQLIDPHRARYSGGRVPHGETPLPPAAEIKNMQAERRAIILRARDRLREAFGEPEFTRFDSFVKRQVTKNITPLSPDASPMQAAAPQ